MGGDRVKRKLNFTIPAFLIVLAAGSFAASWAGWFPAQVVENLYARRIYPLISSSMGRVASAIGLSWLDLGIPCLLLGISYMAHRRKWLQMAGLIACGYLFFFWGWGLNYHRAPLVTKVDFASERVTDQSVDALARESVSQLNALYQTQQTTFVNAEALRAEAGLRVEAVVRELDGVSGTSIPRIKTSRILNPFFRMAGVDGMFNPFGHEALVVDTLLPFERPMIVMHEIAHVLGYPNEGDANFVALMAAVNSSSPTVQYSGWLFLWLYLRSSGLDELLEEGPRRDLAAISERMRRYRIDWVNRTQTRALDLYLKANRVEGGVRSYAQIVTLAVGTRPSWERFGR